MITNLQLLTEQWNFTPKLKTTWVSASEPGKFALSGCCDLGCLWVNSDETNPVRQSPRDHPQKQYHQDRHTEHKGILPSDQPQNVASEQWGHRKPEPQQGKSYLCLSTGLFPRCQLWLGPAPWRKSRERIEIHWHLSSNFSLYNRPKERF